MIDLMSEEALYALGDAVMLVAILGVTVFTASYALFFHWRKTPAGRSLMYFTLSLFAWSVQSYLSRLNPDYPGREWTRLIVYLLIAAAVWRLVLTLWRSWGRPWNVESRKRERDDQ